MKAKHTYTILFILLLLTNGCKSSDPSTKLVSTGLYLDPEGTQPTEVYDARAIFYCMVTLDQLASDTVLKASWVAVETNRTAPNLVIKVDEVIPTSSTVLFRLQNEGNFWPSGKYSVYLYINGKEADMIPFDVIHNYFPE